MVANIENPRCKEVNEMKLPGFTAEASLDQANAGYQAKLTYRASDELRVVKAGRVEPAQSCDWYRDCCMNVGGNPAHWCCKRYAACS